MKQLFKLLLVCVCVAAFTACGAKAVDTAQSVLPSEGTSAGQSSAEPLPQSVLALKAAKENNPDTVAWLRVHGTEINDAVLQSTDNSYYLHRDENGKYSTWGCYFADYYSTFSVPAGLRQNTVIYGHSQSNDSPNGKRFSQLFRYLDMDFLKENHNLYLTVGDEELTFEVCAVFITDIGFYYINPSPSDGDFAAFSDAVAAKNEYIFDSGRLTEQDRLLTLSACSYQYDVNNTGNQRIVVMARLVEGDAQSFGVAQNPSPQRP